MTKRKALLGDLTDEDATPGGISGYVPKAYKLDWDKVKSFEDFKKVVVLMGVNVYTTDTEQLEEDLNKYFIKVE